jgi:hypothetical protein
MVRRPSLTKTNPAGISIQPNPQRTTERGHTSEEKNSVVVELGRLGGKKSGNARAEKFTKEQRFEIARKAARAR